MEHQGEFVNQAMTDLQKLERDAFRRFYEDGIFDIFIGAMLLVFFASSALWQALENEVISYVGMLALGLLVTVPLLTYRRHLLHERLGTFKPGPRRKVRLSRTRWMLVGSVALGLVAFGVAAAVRGGGLSVDFLTVGVPVLWFINAVVVFGAMAYFLDVPRFAVYGVVFGLLWPLMVWPEELWGIEIPVWSIFGVTGIAVIAVGLYKLRRFLQQYPAPQHS